MSVFNEPLGSMARYSGDPNYSRDESRDIRNQFVTREGTYKLLNHSEYARPTRLPMANGTTSVNSNLPVKVSLVRSKDDETGIIEDRLCFNIGKEIYVYPYNGIKKAADLTRPLDKRLYRGTSPTCHDFNSTTARTDHLMLVIGFSAGQVQLVDPVGKELSKLFNEDRLIDKTKVTCIKWLPGSPNQFLVSHLSGQLYVYHEELPCCPAAPTYQLFKQGEGFSVYTCKTKSTRNPLYRWLVDGSPGINEFSFSPCSRFLAMACQDGFLRVYNFDQFEFLNKMKSYFGGLLSVCWSPDGKYVATGGEDDLVTVWSFHEARVVCRGRGHTSWVNVVAFDSYNTLVDGEEVVDFASDEDDDYSGIMDASNNAEKTNSTLLLDGSTRKQRRSRPNSGVGSSTEKSCSRPTSESETRIASYRFGSVGQDTRLCLWDLTEDILKQASVTTITPTSSTAAIVASDSIKTVKPIPGVEHFSSLSSTEANHHSYSTPTTNVKEETPVGVVTTTFLNTSSSSSGSSSFSTRLANQSNSSDHSEIIGKKKSGKFSKGYNASTLPSFFSRNSSNSTARQQPPNSNSTLSSATTKSTNHHNNTSNHAIATVTKLLGTPACPGLHEVPLIEPLTCKKIAHERMTSLIFLEDCFITSCQEGTVYTWARPGRTPHSTSSNISASKQQTTNSLNS